ncbi:hypothetical protein [Streptomyces sp. NPDC059176]|uniref:hypothetical protein n=1 Tax=unclassified Streptomyces TaxID=2593676 RepID=UPI0036C81781
MTRTGRIVAVAAVVAATLAGTSATAAAADNHTPVPPRAADRSAGGPTAGDRGDNSQDQG